VRTDQCLDPQVLSLILDTRELALEVNDLGIARRLTDIAISMEAAMLADWRDARGYDGMAQ
jgi:hypothetical protein